MKTITQKQTIKRPEPYIPPRCRKPRTRYVDEEVELSVTEYEDSEVPVAFVIHGHDGETTRIRSCGEGKFLKEETYRTMDEGVVSYHPATFDPAKFLKLTTQRDWGQEVDFVSEESERSQREDKTRYAVVDGILYRQCAQPFYQVQTFGIFSSWIFAVEIPAKDYQDYEYKGTSPDDRTELQSVFDNMNKHRWTDDFGKTLDEKLHFERIEVLMPECCTHKFQPSGNENAKWEELGLDKQLEKELLEFALKKREEYARHFRYLNHYDFSWRLEWATDKVIEEIRHMIG